MAEDKGKKKQAKAAPKKEKAGADKGEKGDKGEPKAKELRPKGLSDLERKYRETCVPALMKEFGYQNPMQVPRLQKIVLNTSVKEALQDVKILDTAAAEIAAITGQRPAIRKARKSISNFKLRKGQPIGAMVTLRGRQMYEFLSRMVNVALPRVRDFKGVPAKAFDGRGNYTMGLTEQTIFPEINFDKVARINGMNLTFVTSATNDAEGMALLKLLGMPFRTA